MADSTTNLDLISSSQASKEITANALFDAESPSALFGRRASTTSALTWGYYGGRLLIAGVPTAVSNGTLALTANTTNYVVAARATGNVTVSTANTNWNDTPNYMRLYQIVAGAATVTSYVDHRAFLVNNLLFALGVDAGNAQQVDQTSQSWARLATTALGNTAVNGVLTATGNNITAFTGTANVTYHVRATGNGLLVHSATMNILQGAANITTANGDTFDVEMITGNTCYVKNYTAAQGLPASNAQVSLIATVTASASPDIFGAAGATINLDNSTPVTATSFAACTSAQVGSTKTVIPNAEWSVTASANLSVDGYTSGTHNFPASATLQVRASSTTTFVLITIEASGTFTATAQGLTTSPTRTYKYCRTGRNVTICEDGVNSIVGTKNGTAGPSGFTGLPAVCQPKSVGAAACVGIIGVAGAAHVPCYVYIAGGGVVNYYADLDANNIGAGAAVSIVTSSLSWCV